jgi:sulfite exporter TauE/SafE
MKNHIYVRNLILALAGIVVGLMSVSLAFDWALYKTPESSELEQVATQYYYYVRTSFVPYIVIGTLLSLIGCATYRLVFVRNWRSISIALGVFALSFYYVAVVFALEDALPYITDFSARVDALLQIGVAHFLTWVAGWFTMFLLIPETRSE